MQGTHCQDSAYDQMRYMAAEAAGVDTNGRRYISGLARFPNDPEAWVSDLSDVRRVCEQRGYGCEGAVDVEGYAYDGQYELSREYHAAEDIVEARTADELANYEPGDRTPRRAEEVRDQQEAISSGRVDLTPEPRVSAYEDPFTQPGMED
jgi:hypothetical protein